MSRPVQCLFKQIVLIVRQYQQYHRVLLLVAVASPGYLLTGCLYKKRNVSKYVYRVKQVK